MSIAEHLRPEGKMTAGETPLVADAQHLPSTSRLRSIIEESLYWTARHARVLVPLALSSTLSFVSEQPAAHDYARDLKVAAAQHDVVMVASQVLPSVVLFTMMRDVQNPNCVEIDFTATHPEFVGEKVSLVVVAGSDKYDAKTNGIVFDLSGKPISHGKGQICAPYGDIGATVEVFTKRDAMIGDKIKQRINTVPIRPRPRARGR